jgi:superfamily II DNA or RNA helicase
MRLRLYRLDEVYEEVVRLARFRAPQKAGFDALHGLIKELDDDLPRLSQDRLVEQCRERGFHVPDDVPYFIYHLATGVGKTRLMGAVISYLYRTGQTRNCLILAPRTAIVDRLERLSQIGSEKYLFLDPTLVPEPNLCFRSNIETFEPRDDTLNVFVLTPQSISGGDRRFGRRSEFRGKSLEEYLQGADDLVVFTDEAHHLGVDNEATWTSAIHALRPKLHFGLTATPKSGLGINVLHSYDLTKCLQEGFFTKAVDILVDSRDEAMTDEEWDRYTIDYALRRLDRKRDALKLYAERRDDFEFIEPVALICARDIAHADEVATWLVDRRGIAPDELLVTHSGRTQTEEDIARLVAIDQPGSKIRVVINVFQLTEGWDVTNVYVIAPLRAMATFQGAVQTMGRGLRLPAGRRVGDPDLDALDVLCFGRESLEEILKTATETFGVDAEAGPPVDVATTEEKEEGEVPIPRKEIQIACVQSVEIVVPSVRQIPADPPLDFDITSVGDLAGGASTAIDLASLETTGVDERISYDFEDVVRIAASRIIAGLRYTSDVRHGYAVEELVQRFLASLGASPERPLYADPVKVAIHLSEEIDRRYKQQAGAYEQTGVITTLTPRDVAWLIPDDLPGPVERVGVSDWHR